MNDADIILSLGSSTKRPTIRITIPEIATNRNRIKSIQETADIKL